MKISGDGHVVVKERGMAATVVLPGVTVKSRELKRPGSDMILVPVLAQRGKHHLDTDKSFFSTWNEDYPRGISSFIVCVVYEVTKHYYEWMDRLRQKALGVDRDDVVHSDSLRFEHDVIAMGNTSNTWHTFAYDDTTGHLLLAYSFKNVRMNLNARQPLANPDISQELMSAFRASTRFKSNPPYVTFQIPSDLSFLDAYNVCHEKDWQIKPNNIDLNGHTNYQVYLKMSLKTLHEWICTLDKSQNIKLQSFDIFYKGESLLNDILSVQILSKEQNTKYAHEMISVYVKVKKQDQTIIVCQCGLLVKNEGEVRNQAKL